VGTHTNTRMTITDRNLLRLMQLSSSTLPVGAYAFSQGLEYAIEAGWLKSRDYVQAWLALQLNQSLARVDIPILFRLGSAIRAGDIETMRYWNDYLLACRESAELRLTDTAPGESLQRLLPALDIAPVPVNGDLAFLTAFVQAAVHWQLDDKSSATGYLWSWMENQVIAATKLMPLGQTEAQKMLLLLQDEVPGAIQSAGQIEDEELGAGLPALAIASMLHETQYTRLFRS